jgi:hypothetical protein
MKSTHPNDAAQRILYDCYCCFLRRIVLKDLLNFLINPIIAPPNGGSTSFGVSSLQRLSQGA